MREKIKSIEEGTYIDILNTSVNTVCTIKTIYQPQSIHCSMKHAGNSLDYRAHHRAHFSK